MSAWLEHDRDAGGGRHRLGRRTTAVLCGILLLGGWTTDALDLHACPHHGLPVATHGGAATAPDVAHHDPAHAAHPDTGPQGSPIAAAEAPRHGEEDHGPCTCIGDCSGPAAVATDGISSGVATDPSLFDDPVGPRAVALGAPQLLPYVLPYALAPPPGVA